MSLRDIFRKKEQPKVQPQVVVDPEEEAKKEEIRQAMIAGAEKAAREGRFSLFMCHDIKEMIKKENVSLDGLEFFYNICEQWDDRCNIPLNFGLFLDELSQDPTVVVGVHRTRLDYGERVNGVPSSEILDDMMVNGLINYGHSNAVGGGAFTDIPSPALTFTPLKGLTGFINLVGPYHDNNTIILAGFPRDLVTEDLSIIDKDRADELYDISNRLNPRVKYEYMMGAIIKSNEGLDEVFTRDEILSSRLTK